VGDRDKGKPGGRPEILWAPWRIEYLEKDDDTPGCIFCEKPRENRDRENLIVHRAKEAYVIMNRYPYNNGHLLIVPYEHTGELKSLERKQILELFTLLQQSQAVLDRVMRPQGYNIGMNLGRLAGAGIDQHLHFHLVPRWGGDTNFMPVVGHTKVISEGLDQTWEKLNQVFQDL
jgi:ATP adenylyltransferase